MDFVAFDIALFSTALIFIGFYFARKISKKLWANFIRVASVISSFIATSLVPLLFDMPTDSVNKVGMYWLYILTTACVFLAIMKRRKSKKETSGDS